MATALIVILISVGVAQGLLSAAHLSGYEQHRSQADEIAQQDQERLRGLSVKQLSSLATPQSYSVGLGGTTYTVSSQATIESATGGAPCTTTGSSAAAYYHTVSTATWTDVNGSHSVSEDSLITPPADGTLMVPVVDQTGSAVSGATVTATGQSSGGDVESAATDSNGCVVFTGLNPDTYTVTVAATGWVDENGNNPLSDTASVTGSGTTRPTNNPEVIGLAGTVNAAFSTGAYPNDTSTTATTVTGEAATDLSWYGAGGSQSMTASKSVTSGSTTGSTALTASSLFPFGFSGTPWTYTNNYRLWAGRCLQEEPPTGYNTATVSPGSTSALTVQEPALDVNVYYNGTRIAPAHSKVIFSSGTGTTCTDTWTEGIRAAAATSTNGVLANPGVPFASTATSGSTASASGQTGTLSVCADYTTGGSTRKATTSGVTATNFAAPTVVNVNITSTSTSGLC
ncbi:MAG TPA: carboxypeptidase-like regulatory domain-containing protein [Solirubrobacteraceae bacterium]|nr:carboxypeptidase-like regulatory domain-containing protein [Solirubrobacteraceae bacterium]